VPESGVTVEVGMEDLVTILDVIEILAKKGSISGLTLDDMKKIGEAIILLEDYKKTVELNVERQGEQKRTQAQLPPAPLEVPEKPAPKMEPPKEQKSPKEVPTEVYRREQQKQTGPAVQAPSRQPSPPPMSKEGQTKIVGKEPPKEAPVEPAKPAPAPAPAPAKVEPAKAPAEEKKQEPKPEQPKPEEPEIPANADLRCIVCRAIITPQQAKLSRLLTNKDLCKQHLDELTKGKA